MRMHYSSTLREMGNMSGEGCSPVAIDGVWFERQNGESLREILLRVLDGARKDLWCWVKTRRWTRRGFTGKESDYC
jgi:hypothetical protein